MISIKERELILKWNKDGKNQQEIANLLNCHQSSVSRFLKKFEREGTIKNLPRSGRPTVLTKRTLDLLKDCIITKIKSENSKYCSVSTKEIKRFVHKEIGKDYSIRHIERIMHRLGFSLITPRPQHLRHDQGKVDQFRDEFKKKLKQSIWVMN